MNERDYILVSELTRIRSAQAVAREVCIDNVASAVGLVEGTPEYQRFLSDWGKTLDGLHRVGSRMEALILGRVQP